MACGAPETVWAASRKFPQISIGGLYAMDFEIPSSSDLFKDIPTLEEIVDDEMFLDPEDPEIRRLCINSKDLTGERLKCEECGRFLPKILVVRCGCGHDNSVDFRKSKR
jgi:hypothetical protein